MESMLFTRDQQMKYAVEQWIEEFQKKRVPEKDNIHLWEIEWKLENISISCEDSEQSNMLLPTMQNYQLIIPRYHTIGTMDVRVPTYSEDKTLLKREKIVQDHCLGSSVNIIEDFDKFFSPYQKINMDTGEITAYMEIYSYYDNPDEIHMLIEVFCSKKAVPYPVQKYTIEQLEDVIDGLEQDIGNKTEIIRKYQAIIYDTKEENEILIRKRNNQWIRSNTVIREMYRLGGKWQDCPVCMCSIEPDQLMIPECYHFICHTCSTKCVDTKCPICREKTLAVLPK